MSDRYRIRIANDSLMFSAGHFITFDAQTCEPLHGHDYHVTAELAGEVGDQGYVVDFVAVQDTVKDLVGELDHRVLLPRQHPGLRVTTENDEITVRFGSRRWVFPQSDCRLLDLSNTTSEMLARWIGHRLLERLETRLGFRAEAAKIELREGGGQSAVWEWSRK
jgi:6-pyruvoyltetrahydropterin/6-carboxytetrahydropterin synthase